MGKGQGPVTRARAGIAATPTAPSGTEAATLLSRIRRELAKQRAGGPIFRAATREEQQALEWLAYESGADMEMDRLAPYAKAFALLDEREPRVLSAIQDPATVLGDVSYPLNTDEVVQLLRATGVNVDETGSTVRRLADEFDVPQLGASARRLFFARHVLQIASAALSGFSAADIEVLGRHLTGNLTEDEAAIAPMIPGVGAYALTTRATAVATRAARKR